MIDEPKAADDHDGANGESFLAPESNTEKQTNHASNTAHRRQKIVRAFITFWRNVPPAVSRNIRRGGRKIVSGIRLADEHSGAITATATVVIAVLTIFYVWYARRQWDEMHNSRRPWVGMSERLTLKRPPSFSVIDAAISSLEGHKKMVDVEFEVEGSIQNFGNSPTRREYEFFEVIPYANVRYDFRESSCKFAEGQSTGINPYPDSIKDFRLFSSMPTRAIFPDVALPIKSSRLSMGIFPEDKGQDRMPLQIWIVGCIVYQDTSGGVHHTKILYSSLSPPTSKEEIVIYTPALTWKPITEFVMEDSDAD